MKMKPILTAQCYTVHPHIQTDEDFVKSMKKIKEIGYNVIQLSGHTKVTPSVVTETLKEYGLKCCITHSPFSRLTDDFDGLVKEHKSWGCPVIGVGGMPGEYPQTAEGYTAFAKKANEIGNRLAEHGMKFAYHNHSHEFKRISGETRGMDILLDMFNENVEFVPDCYWLQYAGVNVYGWLYNLKGRASVVHYKDYRISPESGAPDFAEIGNGNMDYALITKICEDIGAKYAAIEQDSCPGDRFDSIKISYEYCTKVLGLPTE